MILSLYAKIGGLIHDVQETDGPAGAPTVDFAEDDGYVSPEFDLPSSSDEEDAPPPTKRAKGSKGTKSALAEEEELALQLLRNRR